MTDTGLFAGVLARGPVPALAADAAWIRAMLAAEVALAAAEAEVGIAPAEVAEAIAAAAADASAFDPAVLGRDAVGAGNPVVPLVRALTARVRQAAGDEAAGWVHYGATSQDVLDTATALVMRDALGAIEQDLRSAADVAAALADEHRGTLMAGRTLLQQALPTTFGLKAAGWLLALDDAAEAVRTGAASLPAQLGGAAGTLASLEANGLDVVGVYARLLELAEPVLPWHTNRVPLVTAVLPVGVAAGVVGKVALDVTLLAQTEVGEVAEVASGRGGSSTLPHKRNPVAAIAARAAAAQAPGLIATLLAAMPQEHERAAGAWHAEWRPLRELLITGGTASSWLGRVAADAGRRCGCHAREPRPHRRTAARRTPEHRAAADSRSSEGARSRRGGEQDRNGRWATARRRAARHASGDRGSRRRRRTQAVRSERLPRQR